MKLFVIVSIVVIPVGDDDRTLGFWPLKLTATMMPAPVMVTLAAVEGPDEVAPGSVPLTSNEVAPLMVAAMIEYAPDAVAVNDQLAPSEDAVLVNME